MGPLTMSIALDIVVLDMSHALAGPTAGAILADLGANVIKLEHPKGDHFRPLLDGAYIAAANRNKRCISIDIKTPEGRQVVEKLIARADVLLENFTPKTMERLGLGFDSARRINPRLIYCSVSGFGQKGPYHDLPGYDVVAQAMCGVVAATGTPDSPPIRIGASWIDAGAGMFTVIGILKALIDRKETGEGKHIDVSLLDTALFWMGPQIAHFAMTGKLPQQMGSGLASIAPYQFFKCQDGHVFIGASTEKFWQSLCRLLKLPHLLKDPRFRTNLNRVKNCAALTQIIESSLAGTQRDHVVAKLRSAGIPCGPILDVSQIVNNEHVAYRGIIHECEHPEFGTVKHVKTPICEDEKMPDITAPSAFRGQHTREVLAELGYSKTEIENLIERKVAVSADK